MILLTLDTSTTSDAAIPVAVDLARRFGEPIQVLLVVDGQLRAQYAEVARERNITLDEVAQEAVDEMAARVPTDGIPEVTARFRHGVDPATTLIEVSEDPEIVLMVMATHGRSGLSRLLTGSVAEEVIRYSRTPVVVVPPGRAQAAPAK